MPADVTMTEDERARAMKIAQSFVAAKDMVGMSLGPIAVARLALWQAARIEQIDDRPDGAIINGRTLFDRMEAYGFRDDLGHRLEGAREWSQLRECFEHLARHADNVHEALSPTPPPEAKP